MQLFELLANLLQGLFAWLPRPYLVNVTERGVLFRRGQPPILKDPGFRWNTPLCSTYEVFSLLKAATEFPPVVLPTRDGKTISVGFVIVWHLNPEDVIKAATTTDDLEEMIGEIGESLLPPLVLAHTYAELCSRIRGDRGQDTVNSKLTVEAQALLEEFGITVDSARINTLAPARVFKLINS